MTIRSGQRTGSLRRALHGAGLLARSRALRRLTRLAERLPTCGNNIVIYHQGEPLYERLLADISAAQHRISVEMYMILNDSVGRAFIRALRERAQAGVEVRLIYDAVGSLGTSQHLFRQLTDVGASVLEYHPVAPWRHRFALFRRNHRKTVVIDGRIAFTGGVNIGDPWIAVDPGTPPWRDSHVRVDGPAARDLENLFVESWFTETGELLRLPPMIEREPRIPNLDEAQVFVIAGGGTPRRRVRQYYLTAITQARHSILITSAYFVPDRAIRKALYRALDRGVKVHLLVPRHSDVAVTLWACQGFFTRFLKRGMHIYMYDPAVLHAKIAVMDGDWSTLGTANLDHLSFFYNLESNVAILDHDTGEELRAQFQKDLENSTEVTLEKWLERPWYQRLKEWLASLIRGWL